MPTLTLSPATICADCTCVIREGQCRIDTKDGDICMACYTEHLDCWEGE